jgi:predicted Zn-dependent peptidase
LPYRRFSPHTINNRYRNMSDLLLHDKLITKQLSNGLKYYLIPTALPQESCELRLIVRVGSLNESEHEQGMAHFIEHLGFKGTKSFQSYELVKALESLGISYGPDMNASTDLTETKYRLTNLSVNSDLSQIKLGLKILYEWAFEMTISHSDVEEEKQVILAEYRAKQGLGQRLLKSYWPIVFGQNSLISRRFPIGLPESFMSFHSADLRAFYDKFYRPENMCIICTGDISNHLADIEAIISSQFDSIVTSSASTAPIDLVNLTSTSLITKHLPSSLEDKIIALNDSQVTIPQVCLEFCWSESPTKSSSKRHHYRQKLTLKVIASILNRRFSKIVKGHDIKNPYIDRSNPKNPAPFIGAGVSVRELVRGLVCYGLTFQLSADYEKDIQKILLIIFFELQRIQIYGITEMELIRAVSKWKTRYLDMEMNADREHGSSIANEIEEYFLSNECSVLTSTKKEADLGCQILRELSLDDVNRAMKFLTFQPSTTPESSIFRVLSVQYRGSIDIGVDGVDYLSNGLLQSYLIAARVEMESMALSSDKIMDWPSESSLEADDVINAVRSLLGIPKDSLLEDRNMLDPLENINACSCCASASTIYCEACSVKTTRSPEPALAMETKSDAQVQYLEEISTYHVVLKNGIHICFKYMSKESANKISFQGFALQGISELNPAEACAFSMLDELASASGFYIKGVNGQDDLALAGSSIQDLQTQTNTSVSTQRHYHHRGIGGSSPAPNLELLLTLLYLRLSSSQIFVATELDKHKQSFMNSISQDESSPYHAFLDRARILVCGDIPLCRPCDCKTVQSITNAMVEDLYHDSFIRDPTEFMFVFLGDLPAVNDFVKLLNQYLGQLKPAEIDLTSQATRFPRASLPFTPIPVMESETKVKETLYQEIDHDKASCMMIFLIKMPCFNDELDFTTSIEIDMMCQVLQSRLLDTLRMKLGKVYFVSVEKSRNSLSPTALISVGFHGSAEDMDQLQGLIEDEILELQVNGPNQEVLRSVKESIFKAHKMNMIVPSYWLFWILDSFKSYRVYTADQAKQSKEGDVPVSVADYLEAAVQRRVKNRFEIIAKIDGDAMRKILQERLILEKMVTIDLRPT